MTTTFRRTLASAAAATALLASFALPSYAQTAAPAAPAAATTPKPERPMHKPGERREHMQQRIAKLGREAAVEGTGEQILVLQDLLQSADRLRLDRKSVV